MKNKEYWFFRLKEDFFFKDKNIRKMKRMPNSVGFEYIVILLELYCLSIGNGGVYEADYNQYGEVDYNAIAADIQHQDISLVRMAVEHLIAVGLIETYDGDGFSYFNFPQVVNSFAKSSTDADRKRFEYNKEKSLPKPEQQMEMRLPDGKGTRKNVFLTEEEYRTFCSAYEDAERIIDIYSMRKIPGTSEDLSELFKIAKVIGRAKPGQEAIENVLKEAANTYRGVFKNVRLSEEEWKKLQRMYAEPEKLVDVVSQRIYANPEKDSGHHYAFCLKIGRDDKWKTLGEKMKEEQMRAEDKRQNQTKEMQKIYRRYRTEAEAGFDPPKEIIETLGEEIYSELKEIAQAAFQKQQ